MAVPSHRGGSLSGKASVAAQGAQIACAAGGRGDPCTQRLTQKHGAKWRCAISRLCRAKTLWEV